MTSSREQMKDVISHAEASYWVDIEIERIEEGWSCPKCYSEENSSIDVFVLSDGTVVELVICANCGYCDHNAMEHEHVKFEVTAP